MTNVRKTVDVLGVGFGPSNLSLAIANEESASPFEMFFIDGAAGADWQPEMLLDGSDIQNNPLRDLVTPRNPQSHYTFINYLKCNGRLFDYLNLGLHYPLRKDYAKYVTWVAGFFKDQVAYNTPAQSIDYDPESGLWIVETPRGAYAGRILVMGTGRSRNIPEMAEAALGARVFHLNDYLSHITSLHAPARIAVLGASQSAVEINLDLMARFPDAHIHAIHRSFSFRQKDTSPFSDYVYFPEFIEYFHNAGDIGRASLQAQLRGTNYSAADKDVLDRLMVSIYEEGLDGKKRVHVHNNTVLDRIEAGADAVALEIRDRYNGPAERLTVDALVLATGFKDLGAGPGKEPFPRLLNRVADQLERRADGALHVMRDYRVRHALGAELYLNGMCESSHGLGDAGSFSLLSIRSTEILDSLARQLAAAPAGAAETVPPVALSSP